jgi:hypothetical protein
MRALAILIEPSGEEHFIAYGPTTKDRAQATRFLNPSVAVKAACNIIYGDRDAFWNSERQHAENTRREHRGWSYRVEEVKD